MFLNHKKAHKCDNESKKVLTYLIPAIKMLKKTESAKHHFLNNMPVRQNVLNWPYGSLSENLPFTVQLSKTINLTRCHAACVS